MSEINKNELFDVIRHGHVWHSKKIKENLDEKLIEPPRISRRPVGLSQAATSAA